MTLYSKSRGILNERIRSGRFHPGNFNFIFMGDSWVGLGKNFDTTFEKVMKQAKKWNPLFILYGGDSVFWGAESNYEKFLDIIYRNVPHIPVFCVPGNHETYLDSTLMKYRKLIGPANYVVDSEKFNLTVIGLNNAPDGFPVTGKSLDFLAEQLPRKRQFSFIVMHVPPGFGKWAANKWPNKPFGIKQGLLQFLDIMKKYKVDRVLVCHIHTFDHQKIMGNKYVLSGGAGSTMDVKGIPHHIVVFNVRNARVRGYPIDINTGRYFDPENTIF